MHPSLYLRTQSVKKTKEKPASTVCCSQEVDSWKRWEALTLMPRKTEFKKIYIGIETGPDRQMRWNLKIHFTSNFDSVHKLGNAEFSGEIFWQTQKEM